MKRDYFARLREETRTRLWVNNPTMAEVALGPNGTAKIPATAAGLEAIETLVAEDVPVIVTEVFALAQMIRAGELYRRVVSKTGRRPPSASEDRCSAHPLPAHDSILV